MDFSQILWFDKLESTNDYLKSLIAGYDDTESPLIVVAREQTHGKGRKGRSWISEPHQNLTFSIFFRIPSDQRDIGSITLVSGLAVADALRDLGVDAMVKWPNDILASGKKICGVLTELAEISQDSLASIVIGIGINVNMSTEQTAKIDRPTTSIYIETGTEKKIEAVLKPVLEKLNYWLEKWLDEGFAGIKDGWNGLCSHINKEIHLTRVTGEVIEGVFAGLGESGELLIDTGAEGVISVIEGDIRY